jgi:hypothetical protein
MNKSLQAIIDKLTTLQGRAEELADSEVEKTADRYADIPDFIEAAIDSLTEALDALSS